MLLPRRDAKGQGARGDATNFAMDADHRYDLIVIGSGPAGQKSAIAAAKLKKRVAIVDRRQMMGGVCVHTGTIPSKTLREAILYLSGYRQRTFYGRSYTVKENITVHDLAFRVQAVLRGEIEVVRSQLKRNGIAVIEGPARFAGPHTVEVETGEGPLELVGDNVLIACGTRPAHNEEIPFDGQRIGDSDQLLNMKQMYKNVIIVGAGVVGMEYASMLAALNIEVTIIDARKQVLEFVDEEIIEALSYHMRRQNGMFRLGEKVEKVEVDERGRVVARLESGKRVIGDALLYTVGRQGNADLLNLGAVGLEPDSRGRLAVNEHYQTTVPHIYAAGDVIGFPSLASASMEQGRLASCHMFGVQTTSAPELFPYGIYTIPEMSMVGKTEGQLTQEKVSYEVGIARFDELAKGQMIGDESGLLKLLFDPDTHKLLGVHTIGEGATELIHIGQAVLAYGGTIDYFRDTVFNYPTLAEAYKVAALDGLNKL
jgi:NAD(P) transhydrogenase